MLIIQTLKLVLNIIEKLKITNYDFVNNSILFNKNWFKNKLL